MGREVCRQLAERGYTVLLGAHTTDSAKAAAAAVGAVPLRLDVTDEESIADAARWVEREYGHPLPCNEIH
ncbi:SDR family NAD(P)-dependent oxidoreductase [Nocardia sp. GP40]|uniref:SDR family NAD(P)-dependent oxidoreductase n=1 Tax=Nocardia sp. GP40 TaxID=3156268 RepID=UPI003D190BE8